MYTPKIYLPTDQMEFAVEETEWVELPPPNALPCLMRHVPTSMVFAIDDDLPDDPPRGLKFYTVREMYAWLTHVCEGFEIPPKEKLIELAQNALALWLMNHGYMGKIEHTAKVEVSSGA